MMRKSSSILGFRTLTVSVEMTTETSLARKNIPQTPPQIPPQQLHNTWGLQSIFDGLHQKPRGSFEAVWPSPCGLNYIAWPSGYLVSCLPHCLPLPLPWYILLKKKKFEKKRTGRRRSHLLDRRSVILPTPRICRSGSGIFKNRWISATGFLKFDHTRRAIERSRKMRLPRFSDFFPIR